MISFHGTPVLRTAQDGDAGGYVLTLESGRIDAASIRDALAQSRLVRIRALSFEGAATLFGELVDHYGLRDSYDAQMQYVAGLMADRDQVDNVAVTVNRRGPYQMIQPHAEGDSTSPLELFGLYCVQNAASGGESLLGLIAQDADHSRLRAKEKAIVNRGLSPSELNRLRARHLDARDVIADGAAACRTLLETPRGSVVVRGAPVTPSVSRISGETLVTYWDNVTVHDHAFHRYHYELLNHLGIFHAGLGDGGYRAYMHVEQDSAWAPADTDSGDVARTSQLFRGHVVHKMDAGELLVFNNRAWTHAANNWPPEQVRTLHAMYA